MIGPELLIVALATLMAGVLVGMTGWGGWIVAGSIAWIFFSPVTVSGMSHSVSVAFDLALIFWATRGQGGQINWKKVRAILLPVVPGAIAGAVLLRLAGPDLLRLGAAALICLGAFPSVWALAGRYTARVGLGFMAGSFSSIGMFPGPPVVVALSGERKAADFLATIGVTFLGIILISLPAVLLAVTPGQWPGLTEGLILGLLLAPLAAGSTLLTLGRAGEGQHTRARTWGRWICLVAAGVIAGQVLIG